MKDRDTDILQMLIYNNFTTLFVFVKNYQCLVLNMIFIKFHLNFYRRADNILSSVYLFKYKFENLH